MGKAHSQPSAFFSKWLGAASLDQDSRINDIGLKGGDVLSLSHVQLFVTPWTASHQTLLSMEFPKQEYWSGLPFPSPGGLPDPGIEPVSPASPT